MPIAVAFSQSSREMSNLNWMEFRELVTARITTALLPAGTLEAHGVANHGAGITAPVVPYGITGSLDGYAGSFSISEAPYRAYLSDVLSGLANRGAERSRRDHQPAGPWSAFPFPSSIILHQPGQGYPKFDPAKAKTYRDAVIGKMTALASETIAKWDRAGLFAK